MIVRIEIQIFRVQKSICICHCTVSRSYCQSRMHKSDFRRKPCNRGPSEQNPAINPSPHPTLRPKQISLCLCLRDRKKKISEPSAPKNTHQPYILVYYYVFMHYWSICGPFKLKIERPDAETLILNVRVAIWDLLNFWTQNVSVWNVLEMQF